MKWLLVFLNILCCVWTLNLYVNTSNIVYLFCSIFNFSVFAYLMTSEEYE